MPKYKDNFKTSTYTFPFFPPVLVSAAEFDGKIEVIIVSKLKVGFGGGGSYSAFVTFLISQQSNQDIACQNKTTTNGQHSS